MPERQSTGEDIPARLVAGRCGGRRGRAGHQLLRGDGDDDPRVAGRRRRRAGHPADAGPGGGARDPPPGAPRQDVPGDRPPARARAAVRLGRPAGATLTGGSRWRCSPRSPGWAGWPSRSSTTPRPPTCCRSPAGFVTWVVCLSVLADALRAAERREVQASTADADAVPRAPRRGFLLGAGLMAVGSVGVGRRRPRARQGPAPGRGRAPPAAAAGRERARGAGGGLGRPGGGRPVADPERQVLPDPHRADPAGDRPEGLAAADPRDGRPRGRAHLRRPDGAPVHARPGSPSTACPTRSAVS